jgi:hypothetical protein
MPDAVASPEGSTQPRLRWRLGLWFAAYGLILLAWGGQNEWPTAMWVPLVFVPVCLVAAKAIYTRGGFSPTPQPHVSNWELLIAFLLLAIGVASGLMLLLAMGWLNLGVLALRPKRLPDDCGEWFKLPLIFTGCLPVWIDLGGSQHDWLAHLGADIGVVADPADLASILPFQIGSRLAILLLVWLAHGLVFWMCFVTLPVLVITGQHLMATAASPSVAPGGTSLRELCVWIGAALLLASAGWLSQSSFSGRGGPRDTWRRITTRAFRRMPEPWLAALVILLQQWTLVETWRAGVNPRIDAVGVGLLLLALWVLRRRTPPGPMRLNSRVGLATALFVLLAAEWTDLNPLRHLSLGLLAVSAASWGRTWSWPLMISGLTTWIATLPSAALLLTRAGLAEPVAHTVRVAVLAAGLLALAWAANRTQTPFAGKTYHDDGWQPVKRFAFTLLCLLVGFQTISAFWPEAQPTPAPETAPAGPLLSHAQSSLFPPSPGVLSWSVGRNEPATELSVSRPSDVPIQLRAPELVFRAAGWQITGRRLIPHGNGQAVALTLTRAGHRASAVFWFQNADRAFVHYLRARQILWSGWNLNRRDLRLAVMFSESPAGPQRLVRLAEEHDWFVSLLNSPASRPALP